MTRIHQFPNTAVWFTASYYLVRSGALLPAGLYILVTQEWLLSPIKVALAGVVLWMLIDGSIHAYRFYRQIICRRIRAELHLDGTSVRILTPGMPDRAFCKAECLAYYPYRNRVSLKDGRLIALPDPYPQWGINHIEMAHPWVEAWWPELDFGKAILQLDSIHKWPARIVYTSTALVMAAFPTALWLYHLTDSTYLAIGLCLGIVIPDLVVTPILERWARGRLVVHFPREENNVVAAEQNKLPLRPECARDQP